MEEKMEGKIEGKIEGNITEAKKKRAEFDALFLEYRNLIESLTEEEKIATNTNGDQEHHKYANQFFYATARKPLTEEKELEGALAGIKHVKGMIEDLKDEVKKYHEKQKRLADGITSVKLLVRYMKLSDFWRDFIRKRLNRDGCSTDTDDTVRDTFAILDDDGVEDIEFLNKFHTMLQEVEEAQ